MLERVAVVTGANRGLGLETCAQLAARGIHVVLTARDARRARTAADHLGVEAVALDVTDADSVEAAAAEIGEHHGTVDILVNNAGVSLDGFDAEVARRTLEVNFFGAQRVTDAFAPLLSDSANVVMVSSGLGQLAGFGDPLRRRFESAARSREALDALCREFIADVADGRWEERGWPRSAYRVSKAALGAFTRIAAAELEAAGVRVNAVCPGWVRTDMGGAAATRSVEEGARGIVWAATLPPGGPSGGLFRDGNRLEW